jgi:hypothetical protein
MTWWLVGVRGGLPRPVSARDSVAGGLSAAHFDIFC